MNKIISQKVPVQYFGRPTEERVEGKRKKKTKLPKTLNKKESKYCRIEEQ